ncbi:MAG TPA: response regulator [Blastocatellia bacterium]|nr:response regulator [Blastocatellia bacterium]
MGRAKKGKILLVEDDPDTRMVLTLLFEMEGFTVVDAEDGQEGYLKACDEPPDLIITDINMPKISGLDLMKLVQQNAALAEIPVVVLSALERNYLKRAKELGAAATCQKPVEFDQILPLAASLVAAHKCSRHRLKRR